MGAKLDDGNWITLVDYGKNWSFAKWVPTGVYKITYEGTSLSRSIDLESDEVGELAADTYVSVVSVRLQGMNKRVRARLDDGNWITLVDYGKNWSFAKWVPTGVYKITYEGTSLSRGIELDSDAVGELAADTYVSVVSVRLLGMNKRVRARLDDGNWITSVDYGKNWSFAKWVPTG